MKTSAVLSSEGRVDKVALVTGGGTGVGRATTLQLAARGYHTIVNYSRSEKDAQQTATDAMQGGLRSLAWKCDVSRDEEVRAMIANCRQQFGRLDVVVNNAATTHFVELGDFESLTESMWDEIFAVNLKGPFFVSRAAAPLLKASSGGAIVNVASVAGIAGVGSSIAYSASKGGLITLTKSLAKALAPAVRVNAVCPGVIVSRWLERHPKMVESAIRVTPLERASTTDDIADAVTFLACDAHMMTGQAIVIDGGRTM